MRVPLGGALAAALVAACSPGSEPNDNGQEPRAEASARATPASAAEPAPAAAPERPAVAVTAGGQRRCGWLSNPAPANWWLTDSEGQWILATQGGDQAPGMDELPDMSIAGWVEINGHYGYGCACLTITADADGRVTRLADARPRPLKQCRADRKLPKPE